MQHINGSANNYGLTLGSVESADENEEATKAPSHPPAMTFTNGQVVTRIWANPNHWGTVTWKVDQVRIKSPTAKGPHAKNLFHSDLWDAMRGLYQANGWIKKTERKLGRGGFRK